VEPAAGARSLGRRRRARREVEERHGSAGALLDVLTAQNYWIEAGYAEEIQAIRAAIAAGDDEAVPAAMSDRWLRDVTLFGPAAEIRDGVEAWRAAGVRTVILVPSSTRGGQLKAFDELIAAFR
jgi:hypothetical protein